MLRLNAYKENSDLGEAKQAEIDVIIQNIEELQATQTELTKQKILQKLSIIWAKIRKVGFKLLGEAKTELIKEAIKQGVKGLLDNPQAPIDFVTDIFGG